MLRPFVTLIFLTLSSLAMPGVLSAQAAVGRVVELDVPAPALTGNLLGTPDIQGAAIYLPPGYDDDPNRRFPVLYLLHGIFDDYGVWTENYEVPAILDRLIDAGRLPDLLVVMPNGGNQYGGGYYRNSTVSGNWGDFIADDLIQHIDGQFRTIADANNRALVGHSMGGYGALHLAMSRPGMFSVVWAMSPCCLAATDDLGFGNDAWKRAAAVASPEDLQALIDNNDFFPVVLISIITAFSPDPENSPIFGDFPFEIVRGEVMLDEAGYDRFLDTLPLRRVHDARAALRDLRGLAIEVGLGDQFRHIPPGTLAFSQALGAERIPHLLDLYDGDHRQLVGTRLETIILPWIGERLSAGN